MRRHLLLCVAVILISQVAQGQVFKDRNRNAVFGFRGGYSLGSWTGLVYDIPGNEFSTVSGFHAGIFTNIRLGDAIAIEPGAYYAQKGWSGSGILDDGLGNIWDGTLTNKLAYLDMPVYFRFYIGGLSFGAGPQASLIISGVSEFEGTFNQIQTSQSENTVSYINDYDFGVTFSLGYEFDFGLSFNATYDVGLTDNVAVAPYYTWTEARNRVLKFSVGFVLY